MKTKQWHSEYCIDFTSIGFDSNSPVFHVFSSILNGKIVHIQLVFECIIVRFTPNETKLRVQTRTAKYEREQSDYWIVGQKIGNFGHLKVSILGRGGFSLYERIRIMPKRRVQPQIAFGINFLLTQQNRQHIRARTTYTYTTAHYFCHSLRDDCQFVFAFTMTVTVSRLLMAHAIHCDWQEMRCLCLCMATCRNCFHRYLPHK